MDKNTTEKLLKESIIYFCQTYIGIFQNFELDVIICISKEPGNVDTVFKFHEDVQRKSIEGEFTDINDLKPNFNGEKYEAKRIKLENCVKKAYFCSLCGQKVYSYKNILFHMTEKHQLGASKLCDDCNFMFEDEDTLNIHKNLTKHGSTVKNICEEFSYMTNGNSNLEINSHPIFPISSKSGKNIGKNYIPKTQFNLDDIFKNEFLVESTVNKDMKIDNTKLWQCSLCDIKCTDFPQFCKHMIEVHSKHACLYCDQVFDNIGIRDEHMFTHSCKCQICGLNFTRQDSLSRHINKYHGENVNNKVSNDLMPCSTFNTFDDDNQESSDEKFFLYSSNPNSMISDGDAIEIHSDEEYEDFFNFGYANTRPPSCRGRRGRFKHITQIDPDRVFMCEVCRINVEGVEAYKVHCEQLHHRIPCPYCGCTYTQKASMERHQRQHTGERPYKCHLCPLMYTRKENLQTHLIRSHASTQVSEELEEAHIKIQW